MFVDDDGLRLGERLLRAVPLPAAVLAGPRRVELRLEGWLEEVEEQIQAARKLSDDFTIVEDGRFPIEPVDDSPIVVEAAVAPSRIADAVRGRADWHALLGVGIVWLGLADAGEELRAARRRISELGGIAPVVKGPGGLGDEPVAAPEIHRRLKQAFDPAGILAPGKFWSDF